MAASSGDNKTACQRCDTQSPLDRFSGILKDKYKVALNQLKKHQPHVVPPWWTSPFVCTNESGEDTIKEHDVTRPATIYRSGINGHVRAAVVAPLLRADGICTKRTQYMANPTPLLCTQQSSRAKC
ncbi:hypothetical protein GX51_02856 [Blastomyces parvus]|uniref:Uncharacterized protein n=1 Tax=Blastomyces parvus TaxID=2060905 RepID=A0A2B7XA42_9EURO|nr:hypothetical protein GX51_02856 [Blastomyces parvus]